MCDLDIHHSSLMHCGFYVVPRFAPVCYQHGSQFRSTNIMVIHFLLLMLASRCYKLEFYGFANVHVLLSLPLYGLETFCVIDVTCFHCSASNHHMLLRSSSFLSLSCSKYD